jgi:hypothetical protein
LRSSSSTKTNVFELMIENEITCLSLSSGKQYGIPTFVLCSCRPKSKRTNEYGAIRPRGASLLCVSAFAFVSRQEAPYPAAASGGYHGDAQHVQSFYIWLFCALALLLFFIVLAAPLCAKASGKAQEKLKERESRHFIGFCLFWSFHVFCSAKKQIAQLIF